MIPLYYKGTKLLTKEAARERLKIGEARLDRYLEELEEGAIIVLYGHRLFMDEEGVKARKFRKEMLALRKLMRTVQRSVDRQRTSLLAPGYCTHRLGVYNG
jgi:hypothetical protein